LYLTLTQIYHNIPFAQGMKKPARAGLLQLISGNLALRSTSPADLASLSACFTGSLWVVLEVPAAYAATFLAGFCSPLWIFRKIAGTASTFRHNASGLS
jgi:hypothetical protein